MKEIKEVIVKEVRSVNRYMIVAGTTEKPEEYAIIEYIPLTNCCDATIDPIYLETLRSWWMIPSSELGFRPTWKVK